MIKDDFKLARQSISVAVSPSPDEGWRERLLETQEFLDGVESLLMDLADCGSRQEILTDEKESITSALTRGYLR